MANAPNPNNPSHRTRASTLRKRLAAGEKIHETDALWLSEYEDTKKSSAQGHYGRSASAREVNATFHMKEAAEAEGEGSPIAAATAAAANALATREEGRRLDALTSSSVAALKEACAVYKDVCLSMRERMEVLEHTHIEMLLSVRAHFMAATQAEGALIQRDAEAKPEDQFLTMLIAKYLGVPVGALPQQQAQAQQQGKPPRASQRRPQPPPNGAPSK